jgi:hypothetical protein
MYSLETLMGKDTKKHTKDKDNGSQISGSRYLYQQDNRIPARAPVKKNKKNMEQTALMRYC